MHKDGQARQQLRWSEAQALAQGHSGPYYRLEVSKEVRKDLSITQQGREAPGEDIVRVRYIDDHTEMADT